MPTLGLPPFSRRSLVGGSNKEKTKWLCHFYFLGKPQQMNLRAGSPRK